MPSQWILEPVRLPSIQSSLFNPSPTDSKRSDRPKGGCNREGSGGGAWFQQRGIQGQNSLVVRQPEGQEQPQFTRRRYIRRHLRQKIRQNDQRGTSSAFCDNLWLISSCQEMASGERQAANRKIVEENLFNSFGAAEQQAETEAFQCGRCKQVCSSVVHGVVLADAPQRKCRYRQAQTRSADEPMTVSALFSAVLWFLLLIYGHRRSLPAPSATTDGNSLEALSLLFSLITIAFCIFGPPAPFPLFFYW